MVDEKVVLPRMSTTSWRLAWIWLAISIAFGGIWVLTFFLWFGDPMPGSTAPVMRYTSQAAALFDAISPIIYIAGFVWLLASAIRTTKFVPLRNATGLILLIISSPLALAAASTVTFSFLQTT